MRKMGRKLNLSRETLVNLGAHQRQKAKGAVAAGPSDAGYFTCNQTVCGTCSCGTCENCDTLYETYCCCVTIIW